MTHFNIAWTLILFSVAGIRWRMAKIKMQNHSESDGFWFKFDLKIVTNTQYVTHVSCYICHHICRVFLRWVLNRLQNSPYFSVFKYARAVKQKVWNGAENRERDWGETLKNTFFSLSPHTPYGRVRLARFARVRLLRHALPISLLILRKKPTVLQSKSFADHESEQWLSCL